MAGPACGCVRPRSSSVVTGRKGIHLFLHRPRRWRNPREAREISAVTFGAPGMRDGVCFFFDLSPFSLAGDGSASARGVAMRKECHCWWGSLEKRALLQPASSIDFALPLRFGPSAQPWRWLPSSNVSLTHSPRRAVSASRPQDQHSAAPPPPGRLSCTIWIPRRPRFHQMQPSQPFPIRALHALHFLPARGPTSIATAVMITNTARQLGTRSLSRTTRLPQSQAGEVEQAARRGRGRRARVDGRREEGKRMREVLREA